VLALRDKTDARRTPKSAGPVWIRVAERRHRVALGYTAPMYGPDALAILSPEQWQASPVNRRIGRATADDPGLMHAPSSENP
jgi:hypothetical protein